MADAQELRVASHGTIGGGPSSRGGLFDIAGGLSLTGTWDPERSLRIGPYAMVGTNGHTHSFLSTGLMGIWTSSRSTSWALLTAAAAVSPIHADPDWKTGVSARSAVVLWYEDEDKPFSVASPTIGLGLEVRSMPGTQGQSRDNEVIFQLAVDPFAAAVYVPFLVGAAIYGLPH